MANVSTCASDSERSVSPIGRYVIEDRFAVPLQRGSAEVLHVWCPVIQDSPVQRVLAIAVEAPGAYTLTRDPEFGNRMLHAQVFDSGAARFTVRYTVERRSLRPMLDPASVGALETPALFARELSAERFVDVSGAAPRGVSPRHDRSPSSARGCGNRRRVYTVGRSLSFRSHVPWHSAVDSA